MTQPEQVRAQVLKLAEIGSLPKSACSKALLDFLKPVLATRVLVEQRAGAGRSVTVVNSGAFTQFIESRFPMTSVAEGTLNRAAGVAQFRDSKALASDMPILVSVRAWSNDVLVHDGKQFDAITPTAQQGVCSFLVENHSNAYTLTGRCALVENFANFISFERMDSETSIPLVIYAGGRFSTNLLDWLAKQDAPGFHLVHFPDYDPVGLSDFTRLRKRLGSRVSLHLPDNLETMFSRFANRKLVTDSQSLLPSLRTCDLPEVRKVLSLIQHHNAGLEQEALLMEPSI